jgi:hypothetical protein
MATHRFNVGQNVRLLQSVLNRSKSIECEILQIMPREGIGVQYRVRGADERFERIAQEHELAEATLPQIETDHPGQSGWIEKFTPVAIKGNR